MTRITPRQAEDRFRRNSKIRFYLLLDYLGLFLYILLVSASALLLDFLLIQVLEFFLSEEIADSDVIWLFFHWYKIGSAFLVLIAAMVHSAFSAASQIKFDAGIFKDD